MVETDFVIRARRSLRGRGRGYLTEGGNGRGEMKCRNFLSGPKPRKIKAMLPCRDPFGFNQAGGGYPLSKLSLVMSRELGKRGGRGESLADRRGLAAGEDGNEERTVGIRVV